MNAENPSTAVFLPFFFFILLFLILPPSERTALAQSPSPNNDARAMEPFSDLNLRLSNRPITPPDTLVLQTYPLTGLSVARPFVAPVPKAVIFEDDHRQRVAVLSTEDESDKLFLYVLVPLSLDPKLPALFQCARMRDCAVDRTPLTGGLGCLALCIKELLEMAALNE